MSTLPPNMQQRGQWPPPGAAPAGLPPAAMPWSAAHPAPVWAAPARGFGFNLSRLGPTLAVAAIVAGVVLGGIGLDRAIAEPSAGTVSLGGTIQMDAAPGWVLAPADESGAAGGWVELRKSGALLYATVVAEAYSGDSAAILTQLESELQSEAAQVSFGDEIDTAVGGNPTAIVVFEALLSDSAQSATVDGELISMVVDGNAVAVEIFAAQGQLDSISDGIVAMVSSVRTGR